MEVKLSEENGVAIVSIAGEIDSWGGRGSAFFVPLLLSLLWDNHAFSGAFLAKRRKATLWAVLYKLLICLALVYTLVILVFTSSRGSYLGVLMGIFAISITITVSAPCRRCVEA